MSASIQASHLLNCRAIGPASHEGATPTRQTCGGAWACPICSFKIRTNGRPRSQRRLLRTKPRLSLAELWEQVHECWSCITKHYQYGKLRKRLGLWFIRTIEAMHGRNCWHRHLHVLSFSDIESDPFDTRDAYHEISRMVPVKTKRSHRTVGIDEKSRVTLSGWRDFQAAQRDLAGPAWSGNKLGLVATSLFGTALHQKNAHRSLVTTCGRVSIEPLVSAYDLRGAAITLMVDNGHPGYRVADRAGTSERMLADVYRHKLDLVSDLGPIENHDDGSK